MKLNELAIRDPQHVMAFGESGSGKSTLVSLLAEMFHLIWISCDNGHSVLYKLPQEVQDNIDIIVIPDTRDAPFAYDTVKKLLKGKFTEVCHMHGIVNCTTCREHKLEFSSYEFNALDPTKDIVVIDHMTSVSDSCKNLITKGKPEDYKLQLDDWGSLRFFMTNLLKDIQAARFNVVCIAQAEEVMMEDKSKKLNPAIGSSEFTKLTGQYFDHIVFMNILNRSHKAGSSTTYQTNIITKSRFDVAIENMEKPSLVPFFDGSHKPKLLPGQQHQKLIQHIRVETAPVAQDAAKPVTTSSTSSLLEKLKQRTAAK